MNINLSKISGVECVFIDIGKEIETSHETQIRKLEAFVKTKLERMGFNFTDKNAFYEFCKHNVMRLSYDRNPDYELQQFVLIETNELICTYKRTYEKNFRPPEFYGSITYEIY